MVKRFMLVFLVLAIQVSIGFAFTDAELKELYYASLHEGRQLTVSEKELVAEWEGRIFPQDNNGYGVDHVAGPDNFGYAYIDGSETGGPEYTWVDLTEAATVTGPYSDDSTLGPFDLGITFPFYGVDYTQVYVCSNGFITFSDGQGNAWTNEPIPDASTPNNYIAWFWDDFTPTTGSPTDVVYIEAFEDYTVLQYGTPDNTFDGQGCGQIILYENGEIILTWHVNTTRSLVSNTVGIENLDGTTGIQACYNGTPADYPVLGTSGRFYLPTTDATANGFITNSETGSPVEGATVSYAGATGVTDVNGYYDLGAVYSGDYTATVTAEGYYPYSEAVTVVAGANSFDFGIIPVPDWQWHRWMVTASDWVEIAPDALELTLGDDASSYINFADYGFQGFSWFGEPFTGMYVISNGWASFSHSNTSPYGVPTPNTSNPNSVLTPYGTDLNPGGGNVYVQSAGDLLTVTWDNVPFYGTANVGNVNTFQIVMDFATGTIQYNYNLINSSASSWHNVSIGYENSTGELGASMYYGPSSGLTLTTDTSYLIYVTDPPIASIYGTVENFVGIDDPLNGAVVTLYDDMGAVLYVTSTGFDGAYDFDIYEAGTYSLSAVADGYGTGMSGDLVVTDADVMYDFELLLLGQISGSVANIDEIPIAGATVTLYDNMGEVVQTFVTQADGLYSFTGLEAGVYDIEATADGFIDFTYEVVSVADGDELIYDFTLEASEILGTVSGYVYNLDVPGLPLEGVTLTISTPVGDLVAITDATGHYEFLEEGVPVEIASGEYILAIDPPNTGDRFYHHDLHTIFIIQGENVWEYSLAEILAPTSLHFEGSEGAGLLSWVAPENYNPPTLEDIEILETRIAHIRQELVTLRNDPTGQEKVAETVEVLNRLVNLHHRYTRLMASSELDDVNFIAGYIVRIDGTVVGITAGDETSVAIDGLTDGQVYTFAVAADYGYNEVEFVYSDDLEARTLPSLMAGYTPIIVDYEWTDIIETGINSGNSGDDPNAGPFTLPDGMSYELFGNEFTDIYINGNGWFSPVNNSTGGWSGSMPSTSVPNNTIAPFWDDMYTYTASAHGQWYQIFEEENYFIVQCYQVDRGFTDNHLSFQVKVDCATGEYYFSYEAGDFQSVSYFRAIGLENANGTAASTFPHADLESGMTIKWVPNWIGEWSEIVGTAIDSDGNPLEGAGVLAVAADGTEYTTVTDIDGNYEMMVDRLLADYTVTFTYPELPDVVVEGVNWVEGEFTTVVDAQFLPYGSIVGTISGYVYNLDEPALPLENVTLTLVTTVGDYFATTDANGYFEFLEEGLPAEIALAEYIISLDPMNAAMPFYHHEGYMVEVFEGVNEWTFELAEILPPTGVTFEPSNGGGTLSWIAPENYNPLAADELEEMSLRIDQMRLELETMRANPEMQEKVAETEAVIHRSVNLLHRYQNRFENSELDEVNFINGYIIALNGEFLVNTGTDATSYGVSNLTNGELYGFSLAADYLYDEAELVFSDEIFGRPLPPTTLGYLPTVVDYEWTDIRETGINSGNTGDDPNAGPFALPDGMSFDLYGNDFTEIYINGNGWISPVNNNTSGWNGSMPSPNTPNNTIAPFWDDLYTHEDQNHGQWYQFFEDDNYFIVQYFLDDRGANTDDLSFQVKVDCETGDYYFSYEAGPWQDVSYFRGIGLENADGTFAATYPQADIMDEMTLHWTMVDDVSEWAQINGTVTDIDGLGIEGAHVVATGVDGVAFNTYTDIDGNYSLLADRGRADYTMSFTSMDLVEVIVEEVNWVDGEFETIVDAQLFPGGSIFGTVSDGTSNLEAVLVELYVEDEFVAESITDVNGMYSFADLIADSYTLKSFVLGYMPYEADVILDAGMDLEYDITFTPVPVSTIEEIQTTGEEGDYVHCIGIATQATNTTATDRFDAVIQDETGYGLKIFRFGEVAQEDGINRGDEVAVFGYVDDYFGITEIVDFEFTVVSTGNELPAPIVQSTLELSGNNAMEGSWAKARGALQQDPDNTGSYTLQLDDGSGSVNVRINEDAELDFGDLGQDDWVEIWGTIGLYQDVPQIIPSEQMDIAPVVLDPPQNFAVELDPDNVTAHCTWGEETHELIFDEDEPASQWFWETGTMGVRLTPDGPCEVLALKYIINFSDNPDNYEFGARVFDWDETAGTPADDVLYDGIGIGDPGLWVEVDVSEEEMTFDGEFVVAFFGANGYSALANNINYDNDRAWDKSSTGAWAEMDDLYYIRAIVRYIGTDEVVELTPVVVENPTNREIQDKEFSELTATTCELDELDNEYIEEYILYRAFNGGDFEELARTEDQFYDDVLSGLESGTYEYYVTALYDAGESEPSNIAGVDYNSVREEDALPTVFAIESAYPNPFNPTVNVKVAIPQVSNLRAHIYNINGRLVESFAINNAQPGYRTITWEAKVSSGLYFMQVSSSTGWQQTQKLILLK